MLFPSASGTLPPRRTPPIHQHRIGPTRRVPFVPTQPAQYLANHRYTLRIRCNHASAWSTLYGASLRRTSTTLVARSIASTTSASTNHTTSAPDSLAYRATPRLSVGTSDTLEIASTEMPAPAFHARVYLPCRCHQMPAPPFPATYSRYSVPGSPLLSQRTSYAFPNDSVGQSCSNPMLNPLVSQCPHHSITWRSRFNTGRISTFG
jgi:hypothetical protein